MKIKEQQLKNQSQEKKTTQVSSNHPFDKFDPGALVNLHKYTKEPVDIYVKRKKYAEGEIVVLGQSFGVRITALVGPKERFVAFK